MAWCDCSMLTIHSLFQYMTWIFGSIFRFMQFAGRAPPTAIIVLFVTFFPLQVRLSTTSLTC